MRKYNNPVIEILIFDEEDDILTTSLATYSAKQLNEYMFNNGVTSTTTIKIQDVKIQ